MKLRLPILALALFLISAGPAIAQTPEAKPDVPEANPEDVSSIDAITAAVYDVISGAAGEKRDWDRFRSLFRPEARLMPLGVRDGRAGMRAWTPEQYIEQAGAYLESNGFFEIEINRVQEEYGHIAHHFSTYESRNKEDDVEPFARGINSFQLMNDGSRWWIVSIFWQQESDDFPIPTSYLPDGE